MTASLATDSLFAPTEISPETSNDKAPSAEDGDVFANLLRRFQENDDRRQGLAQAVAKEKARLQEQAISLIVRRSVSTRMAALGPATAATGASETGEAAPAASLAARLREALGWFSNKSGARDSFLQQLQSQSGSNILGGVLDAIETLRASLSRAVESLRSMNGGASNVTGVFSQVTSFSLSVTSETTAASAMDVNPAALPGLNANSRVTVKMQLQMMAIQRFSQTTVAQAQEGGTSITLFNRQVDLHAYLLFMDPLVLDLNGDGVDLRGLQEDGGVTFDLAGDGTARRCGWVQGDDALLFIDRDGDGLCGDGKELFGDQEGDANGFEKLRRYDSDGNGVIDQNDVVYAKLKTWNDLNGDGVCDANEVRGLREAGVASINLGYAAVNEDNHGNRVSERSFYTALDGAIHDAVDAQFQCETA